MYDLRPNASSFRAECRLLRVAARCGQEFLKNFGHQKVKIQFANFQNVFPLKILNLAILWFWLSKPFLASQEGGQVCDSRPNASSFCSDVRLKAKGFEFLRRMSI